MSKVIIKQIAQARHSRGGHVVCVMAVHKTALAAKLRMQEHNSLIAVVLGHYDKMSKGKDVSSFYASDGCCTFDVLRQTIELNQQGPLKLELDKTDFKFDIRPGGWKK